jgi:hypothetical protein
MFESFGNITIYCVGVVRAYKAKTVSATLSSVFSIILWPGRLGNLVAGCSVW